MSYPHEVDGVGERGDRVSEKGDSEIHRRIPSGPSELPLSQPRRSRRREISREAGRDGDELTARLQERDREQMPKAKMARAAAVDASGPLMPTSIARRSETPKTASEGRMRSSPKVSREAVDRVARRIPGAKISAASVADPASTPKLAETTPVLPTHASNGRSARTKRHAGTHHHRFLPSPSSTRPRRAPRSSSP